MRPFVYYLTENFLPPEWVAGRRVVDFSTGLGDLAAYSVQHGAASVVATVPEADPPGPPTAGVDLRAGVLASRISERLEPESVDVFCARMVFQFPRWEDEGVDADVMLRQIATVLAPGGRVVVASHAFFPLQNYDSLQDERDSERLLNRLVDLAAGAPRDVHEILTEEAQRVSGLTEMVRYLGLPPRESSTGSTGYGLRVPALVSSFIDAGLTVDVVDDVEPFTFPLGVWERFDDDADGVRRLGSAVFDIKRRWLTDDRFGDVYGRPALIRRMLQEIRWLVPIVWTPIVRIVAHRPR